MSNGDRGQVCQNPQCDTTEGVSINRHCCAGDGRIKAKEKEKIGKYQDLARALRKLLSVKVRIVPVMVP